MLSPFLLASGPDEINYRRFFDVNELAALSIEGEEVFEAAHQLVLKLLAQGTLSGIRIDHPLMDSLTQPIVFSPTAAVLSGCAGSRSVRSRSGSRGNVPLESARGAARGASRGAGTGVEWRCGVFIP